jgi:hypothetical protein
MDVVYYRSGIPSSPWGRFSDYSATGTQQRFQWRVGKLVYTTISLVAKSKSF